MPPKLVFVSTPTGGPSWCCSAPSLRGTPPGPTPRGGTGFGGGTTFRSCTPCAERASARSDTGAETAEFVGCETLGVLETVWPRANPGIANSAAKPQTSLTCNVLFMICSRYDAVCATLLLAQYGRRFTEQVNKYSGQFAA